MRRELVRDTGEFIHRVDKVGDNFARKALRNSPGDAFAIDWAWYTARPARYGFERFVPQLEGHMSKARAQTVFWGVVVVVIGGLALNAVLRRYPNL
jgi:hypothetical protein